MYFFSPNSYSAHNSRPAPSKQVTAALSRLSLFGRSKLGWNSAPVRRKSLMPHAPYASLAACSRVRASTASKDRVLSSVASAHLNALRHSLSVVSSCDIQRTTLSRSLPFPKAAMQCLCINEIRELDSYTVKAPRESDHDASTFTFYEFRNLATAIQREHNFVSFAEFLAGIYAAFAVTHWTFSNLISSSA